jgi:hypothetical protein
MYFILLLIMSPQFPVSKRTKRAYTYGGGWRGVKGDFTENMDKNNR